jgi:hypothetical protein
MKRFMIVIDQAATSDAAAMSLLIDQGKCGWWHWLNDLWLIVDPDDNASVASWVLKLRKLINTSTKIFIEEVKDGQWSVFAPPASHAWLEESWGTASPPTPFQSLVDRIVAEREKGSDASHKE